MLERRGQLALAGYVQHNHHQQLPDGGDDGEGEGGGLEGVGRHDGVVLDLLQVEAPGELVCAYTLSLSDPDTMRGDAQLSSDLPLLKMKVGNRKVMECIKAVRSGAPESSLIVDANEAWTEEMLRVLMPELAAAGVSLLEQPGISREQLLGQIAYPQSTDPEDACVVDPIRGWNLPLATGSIPALPAGYRLCVWTTSMQEATNQQLLAGDASPGVYVIQALPEQLTTSHLPSRLLFCRPKPFC